MLTLELSEYVSTSAVTLEALAALAMHVASEPTKVAFGVGAGISTAAGIPDFRGGAKSLYGADSVRHPTRGHSTLDDTRLTTTRTTARTKELFHYDALLRQESRADHLGMMATLRKAAKRATRKGEERATSDEAAAGSEGAPTAFHGLMKRVAEKGRLARVYSQNIDGLEAAAAQSRIFRSKRAIEPAPLAFLRPAVVLYDDPSSASSAAAHLISSTIAADLISMPACLIVAGTCLRIPGFRSLVKDTSRTVRRNGGWSILVNREAVGKEWDSFFDYHFLGDTEVFAKHLTAFLDSFVPGDAVSTLPDPPSVLASAPPAVAQTPVMKLRALSPLSALSLPPTPPSSAHSPLPPEPRTRGERVHTSLKRSLPPACSPTSATKKRKKAHSGPAFEGAGVPEGVEAEEAASAYPSPPPSSQPDCEPAPRMPASSPAEVEALTSPEATVAQPRADAVRKLRNLEPLSIAEVLRRAEKQARRRRRAQTRARASARGIGTGMPVAA